MAFVELQYPPKWLVRASPDLQIRPGAHGVEGIASVPDASSEDCLPSRADPIEGGARRARGAWTAADRSRLFTAIMAGRTSGGIGSTPRDSSRRNGARTRPRTGISTSGHGARRSSSIPGCETRCGPGLRLAPTADEGLHLIRRVFTRKIPRIIHYCWVGGRAPSEEMVRCIETWRTHHPGFEIRRWDESNVPADPFIDRALAGRPLVPRLQRGPPSRALRAWRHLSGYRRRGAAQLRAPSSTRLFPRVSIHPRRHALQAIRDVRGERRDGSASETSAGPGDACRDSAIDRGASRVRDSWAADGHGGADPRWFARILGYAGDDCRGHDSSEGSLLSVLLPGSIRSQSITPSTFSVHHWAKRW